MDSTRVTSAKRGFSAIAVSSTILIGLTTAALAASYKTRSNEVVVTGLQANTKYPVGTTNFSGRSSTRTVTTNGCGEALISNGTGYQRLVIHKQTITPSTLPTQTHQRCNPRRHSNTTNTPKPPNK